MPLSGEITITFYYVLRLPPEGNMLQASRGTLQQIRNWKIIMIMKTEIDHLADWLYELPDERQVWLERVTPWEYDMLDAVDIPVFTNHSDLVFARNGWTPTGWEGTTEG